MLLPIVWTSHTSSIGFDVPLLISCTSILYYLTFTLNKLEACLGSIDNNIYVINIPLVHPQPRPDLIHLDFKLPVHQKVKLALTHRRGTISLIPKKDKALQELKNWRPITLLNCDYKIASKAIDSHLKALLQNLADNNQTGFLKGLSIAENICLINNLISYTE